MSAGKHGGPAFPHSYEWRNDSDLLCSGPSGVPVSPGGVELVHATGMSLRDYFAAKAMHALLSTDGTTRFEQRAKEAYEMADAMLAERAKATGAAQ